MRDDTHPDAAATKGAGMGQAHTIRIQFCVESIPMGREFKEAELLCATSAYGTLEDFARLLACTGQPESADQPLTLDDLLDVMIWALISNGMAPDQITRAADEAEEEYYMEAGEEEEWDGV